MVDKNFFVTTVIGVLLSTFLVFWHCLNVDWDYTLCPEENSVEKMWMIFKDRLLEGIDMYIPKINNGSYNKSCAVHPFNYDFKQMINKKHRLWTRYLETRNPTVLLQYKKARNIVKMEARK